MSFPNIVLLLDKLVLLVDLDLSIEFSVSALSSLEVGTVILDVCDLSVLLTLFFFNKK